MLGELSIDGQKLLRRGRLWKGVIILFMKEGVDAGLSKPPILLEGDNCPSGRIFSLFSKLGKRPFSWGICSQGNEPPVIGIVSPDGISGVFPGPNIGILGIDDVIGEKGIMLDEYGINGEPPSGAFPESNIGILGVDDVIGENGFMLDGAPPMVEVSGDDNDAISDSIS